jgi:hypothetical protein
VSWPSQQAGEADHFCDVRIAYADTPETDALRSAVAPGMWLQWAVLRHMELRVTRWLGWIANSAQGHGRPRMLAEVAVRRVDWTENKWVLLSELMVALGWAEPSKCWGEARLMEVRWVPVWLLNDSHSDDGYPFGY